MSRLASWFRATPASASGTATADTAASKDGDKAARESAKMADMDDALACAGLMMNDDIDGAIAALTQRDTVFHGLGLGVTSFMRSVLGFEKEVMTEAATRLADVESRAWSEQKAAQRKGDNMGGMYASGTEYSLVAAQSQLMSAVISVLHESLTEGIKGFYKLRKAYVTLDGIVEAERRALGGEGAAVVVPHDHMPGSFDDDEFGDLEKKDKEDEDSDEFVDAKETPIQSGTQTPAKEVQDASAKADGLEKDLEGMKLSSNGNGTTTAPDAKSLTNPLDIFIFTGSNMCFGVLLLLLSMIPPAMSRLLSIIGFRGDRARGIRMLWSATRFHNINGAVSGLALLGYYNGILGTADIIPPPASSPLSTALAVTEDERATIAVPSQKCHALLAEMRARYPSSGLWLLEEARILAQDRKLPEAIATLTAAPLPKMRQVAALTAFELALDAMFAQDWALTRDSFLKCMDLNDWSHCLYLYIAGSAELELYRDARHAGDAAAAATHKSRAEELMRRAPTVAGRKKFLAKQLPFDVFVQRKMAKLEARAAELGVDLADAAGVSPALEMAALWCGTKRMGPAQLASMEAGLAWDRCTAGDKGVAAIRGVPDEVCVRAVTLASVLRCQGRYAEARALLKDEALAHDRTLLKGGQRDDYALPNAYYELAALAWSEAVSTSAPETAAGEDDEATRKYRLARAAECQEHLDTVAAWEPYVFDARLGMRVQAGQATLGWFRGKMGASG